MFFNASRCNQLIGRPFDTSKTIMMHVNLIIQILKIAKGTNTGISTGDYDEEHKILRQRFHQTLTKLSGRDKVDEIVQYGFLKAKGTL